MFRQTFYWSMILLLVAMIWTDFNVEEFIEMGPQSYCIWTLQEPMLTPQAPCLDLF